MTKLKRKNVPDYMSVERQLEKLRKHAIEYGRNSSGNFTDTHIFTIGTISAILSFEDFTDSLKVKCIRNAMEAASLRRKELSTDVE